MSRPNRSRSITPHFCFYRTDEGLICGAHPRWSLRPDAGLEFKSCDLHLADGLRKSGLPAKVDAFSESPTIPGCKHEPSSTKPTRSEKEVALPKCSKCKKIPLICKCQEFEDLKK